MNAPLDRLHADLADLAEQVSVVDLRDRALRTSHRMAVRRTLTGVAAALAVLAAGGGTAFAVLPQRHAALPPAVQASASPTQSGTPAASAPPTPLSPSTSTPPPPASSAPSATMPGLYLYRLGEPPVILYRPAGGAWRTVATLTGPSVPNSNVPPAVVPSPDRRSVAWVLDDGKIQVSAPDGSHVRTLTVISRATDCLDGARVVWTGDSRRLLFVEQSIDGKSNFIETINGDGSGFNRLATVPAAASCQLTSSGDGRTIGYLANKKILMIKVDGTGQRTLGLRLPDNQVAYGLVAASRGADRLLVATVAAGTDCGCSPPQDYYVVDTGTGRATRLNQGGTAAISGTFTGDGRVVLIDDLDRGAGGSITPRLTLFGPDGAVLSHATLPTFEYGRLLSVQG